MTPLVSVVVPTLNAGARFEELLTRISEQDGDLDTELLVIDSGSDDGTVELARACGAAVHEIPKGEFDHGAARNLGASHARGEFVAFIVQDALPLDRRWLGAMVENMEDRQVAGVYGRQLPRPGCGALTRALMKDWPTSSPRWREQYAPGTYSELPPEERLHLATFDDVSSCLRRSVWEDIPFETAGFGEDLRWGKRVLEAGYKLVYEPRSTVFHSHERGLAYDLKRHYVNQLLLLELFGIRQSPNLGSMFANTLGSFLHLCRLLLEDERPLDALRLAPHAAGYAVASQVGTYLAGKRGRYPQLDRFLGEGV